MVIVVNKIGTGTDEDPFKPDTEYTAWEVLEERATEFTIRVFDEVVE